MTGLVLQVLTCWRWRYFHSAQGIIMTQTFWHNAANVVKNYCSNNIHYF